MDFLFLNHSASVEAIIVFLSLGIIFLFLLYDAIIWLKKKYREYNPRKTILEPTSEPRGETQTVSDNLPTAPLENTSTMETTLVSPMLEESEPSEVQGVDTEIATPEIALEAPTGSEETVAPDAPEAPTILPESRETEVENIPSTSEEAVDSTEALLPDVSLTGDAQDEATETVTQNTDEKISSDTPSTDAMDFASKPEVAETSDEKILDIPEVEKKHTKEGKKKTLSPEKKEKVVEIVNNAKTLIARGHIDDARTLIVNGLSLEKNNRELNLLMAGLYEREHAFEKAEFVLKELAEHDPDDVEVLNHLATVVAMQRKFEVSYEIYKKILSLAGDTEEVLYTLSHIASELDITEDVYTYSKSYLKQFPKNPEILWLYSQSQISKADRKGAIETLIKLKNLTPYNQEIVDLISKLVTEDELAGNFGENTVK